MPVVSVGWVMSTAPMFQAVMSFDPFSQMCQPSGSLSKARSQAPLGLVATTVPVPRSIHSWS